MAFAIVSGIQIHYIEKGAGKPLLLLHGNAGSGKVWRKVIPFLSSRYRVIAHDRQGFGLSEKREEGKFSPRAYCRELAGLMDTLGVDKAHVCGLSFGGMVAQCFALDFSDRVESLVLVGTTADRTGRSVPETLEELHREGWPNVADRLTRSWFRSDSHPADISEAYQIALQSSERIRELTVKALGDFDIRNEISRIDVPTLILVGENDITCPPTYAEAMHERIQSSKLAQIPKCAHLVPIEQPDEFCKHVLAFLAVIDGESSTELD